MREKYEDDFQAGMGAEAIRTLLENRLGSFALGTERRLFTAAPDKNVSYFKRLEVVEAFPLPATTPNG